MNSQAGPGREAVPYGASMKVTFLGTGGTYPTASRNVTSHAVRV